MRIATYNILNTKDRYQERELLLKQCLYSMQADIIGLQEVVFGPDQLDELTQANGPRHNVEDCCITIREFTAVTARI